MEAQAPGELTAVSVAVLNDGTVAQAVIDERTQCFARLHADGAWSGWRHVADGVRDVSVTADAGQGEALIAVVVLVPLPTGGHAALHTFHRAAHFRLSSAGVTAAL